MPTTPSDAGYAGTQPALVERLFALLHDSRAVVPQLAVAGTEPELVSAQAERLLCFALVGAIEAGLVRTAEDTLIVLRQASQPLGRWARRGRSGRSRISEHPGQPCQSWPSPW
jgi:hypothetical protein